jgi:cytidylate kinase
MSTNVGLDKCFTFIHAQLQPGGKESPLGAGAPPRRFVTLSRQAGCGAHVTAEKLAELLEAQQPGGPCPWTVFDRNLVEQVLEDHHLPKRLEKYMPEDSTSEIADIMDEVFDLHPSSWTLVHKMSETILRLATLGNCVLIGRGANVITAKLEHGLHVRLIGSLEKRAERLQRFQQLTRREALALAEQQDRARNNYVKKYFGRAIDDPSLYDLVINTDSFSCDEAAALIALAVLKGAPIRRAEPAGR